jgi:uncharacterized membrane protein
MQSYRIILKPERFFLSVASIFGFIYALIIPPFQSPDEYNHFFRAYQISQGQFSGTRTENRLGGVLPTSLLELSNKFTYLKFQPNKKLNKDTFSSASHIKLDPERKQFIDFTNTAIYPPTAYIPQTTAVLVGRTLRLNPLLIIYLGRLFNLAAWIALVYLAIKWTPSHKWTICLLALLPASIFIQATNNADVTTNGLSFLAIALAWLPHKLSTKIGSYLPS